MSHKIAAATNDQHTVHQLTHIINFASVRYLSRSQATLMAPNHHLKMYLRLDAEMAARPHHVLPPSTRGMHRSIRRHALLHIPIFTLALQGTTSTYLFTFMIQFFLIWIFLRHHPTMPPVCSPTAVDVAALLPPLTSSRIYV